MRLAGGGAVSVEYRVREREKGGREREKEKQSGREGAGGLVALHNTRWSSLECWTWCLGTSFTIGGAQPPNQSPERRAKLERGETSVEESSTKKRFRKRSPRKHISRTHTHSHMQTQRQEEILDMLCKQWLWRDW